MPVKKRVDKRREPLPQGIEHFLITGTYDEGGLDKLKLLRLKLSAFRDGPESELSAIWRELRPQIMREFRGKKTRPWATKYLEENK